MLEAPTEIHSLLMACSNLGKNTPLLKGICSKPRIYHVRRSISFRFRVFLNFDTSTFLDFVLVLDDMLMPNAQPFHLSRERTLLDLCGLVSFSIYCCIFLKYKVSVLPSATNTAFLLAVEV